MKFTGRATSTARLLAIFLPLLILTSHIAQAELSASVDRERITMGDTFRLTVTATANETINNLDLRPLFSDFEVLRRTTSSNTSIVNGQRTNTRQVMLDMTPRRDGTLRIPSLRAGSAETNYLLLSVSAAPNAAVPGQSVSFSAEVDKNTVYVQGQLILTLRIMQSVNLESRNITDLQLDSAFVRPLEQQSFQRTIDGKRWLVHEIRYAIFPEESGTLVIPAQIFSASESSGRRSILDFGSSGRALKRTSEALSIKVLPRPDSFSGSTWLPAQNIEIEESWSKAPDQLKTGESVTRTIKIIGEGLQGAQLPPTLFPAVEGLKFYPDQPVVEDLETSGGLVGSRIDSVALITTQVGSWTMPEIRIPWWDTQSGKMRYAVLPARTVIVTAGSGMALDTSPITIVGQGDTSTPVMTTLPPSSTDAELWRLAAIVCALGWSFTLAYLWLSRTSSKTQVEPENSDTHSEKQAFKALIAACAANNPAFSRSGIIRWTGTLFPEKSVLTLDDVMALFNDNALSINLTHLNDSLYSEKTESWKATELAKIAQDLRKTKPAIKHNSTTKLELYPH